MTFVNPNLAAALEYEALGWHVFPLFPLGLQGECSCSLGAACDRAGKHTWLKSWALKERPTPEMIREWWGKRPASGIGVATGHRSGIGVLDVDGEAGAASLEKLLAEHGPLPEGVWIARTGSGGSHFVFSYPAEETYTINASQAGPGLDIRGQGGYIVAAPTRHKSGGTYEWTDLNLDDSDPSPMPEWLAELARGKVAAGGHHISGMPFEQRFEKDLEGRIIQGTQNDYLFRLACKFMSNGLTDEEIRAALTVAHETRLATAKAEDRERDVEKAMTSMQRYKQAEKEEELILSARRPRQSATEFLSRKRPTLVRTREDWFAFDEVCYQELEDGTIRSEVYDLMAQAKEKIVKADGSFKTVPFEPNAKRVTDSIDSLRALAHKPAGAHAPPCWLYGEGPPAEELMVCQNGIFHPLTGEFMPSTPRLFAVNALGLSYDADAPVPVRWHKFLEEVWPDGRGQAALLQEWMGYLLTPDTSQQKMLALIGKKRSGKGTIGRVIKQLVGEPNVAGISLSNFGETFALQPLLGKTLALLADVRIGPKSDQGAIAENLLRVTGEDLVTVNRKKTTAVSEKLPVRFMILSNEAPRIQDGSGTLASRMMPLEMTVSFYDREDKQLDAKLTAELPGILNWAIEGLLRLHERGRFTIPEDSQELINDFENLGSSVRSFVADSCEVGEGFETVKTELYPAYVAWCVDHGEKAKPETVFGRDLVGGESRVRTVRKRTGGSKQKVYLGIRIRPFEEEPGGPMPF